MCFGQSLSYCWFCDYWDGKFAYAWWLHSHSPDGSGNRCLDSCDSETQSSRVRGNFTMKNLMVVGVLLIVLGLISFLVPIPRSEDHSVKIGDAKIGVTTQNSEKLPPAVGIVLLVGGILVLVVGSRKT